MQGMGQEMTYQCFQKREPRLEATEKYPKDLFGQEAGAAQSKRDL